MGISHWNNGISGTNIISISTMILIVRYKILWQDSYYDTFVRGVIRRITLYSQEQICLRNTGVLSQKLIICTHTGEVIPFLLHYIPGYTSVSPTPSSPVYIGLCDWFVQCSPPQLWQLINQQYYIHLRQRLNFYFSQCQNIFSFADKKSQLQHISLSLPSECCMESESTTFPTKYPIIFGLRPPLLRPGVFVSSAHCGRMR